MRRPISFLLVLILLLGITPFSFAGGIDDYEEPDGSLSDDLSDDPLPDNLPPETTEGEAETANTPPEESASAQAEAQPVNPLEYRAGDGSYEEDRIIVQLKSTVKTAVAADSSTSVDLGVAYREMRLLPSPRDSGINTASAGTGGGLYLLMLEDVGAQAVENALEILSDNPSVEFAQPSYIYEYQKTPNDPLYGEQYALSLINAQKAWDYTTGSKSIVVGVMDTGIDGRHPDLSGNLWSGGGKDFLSGKTGTPTDPSGHGTQVAGIIGAKGNNKLGVTSICWDVSLAWLGVGYNDTYSRTNTEKLIEALAYATEMNIPILNNSYGNYTYDPLFKNAIDSYPGLFVAAAGNHKSNNDSRPFYPASYDSPRIISVASVNIYSALSDFSNYGQSVHIAAPGESVYTTRDQGKYKLESGTSFSSPYVAGTAALMLSVNSSLTPEQIKNILLSTSRKVSSLKSYGGFGILDAGAAVASAYKAANGWRQSGNNWYYYVNNTMQTEKWVKSGNTWYYLKSDGTMASGEWITAPDGKRYYLKSGGAMATGWLKWSNDWYYLASGGARVTGWLKWSNNWYYLKPDDGGKMASGEWITPPDGKIYYLKSGGKMAANDTLLIGDREYTFNRSGACIDYALTTGEVFS